MSEYTKGPWEWRDRASDSSLDLTNEGLIVSGDTVVCDFGDNETYYNTAGTRPSDADIALICASPELLVALEALTEEALKNMRGGKGHLIDDARAAIAKAKGGVKC